MRILGNVLRGNVDLTIQDLPRQGPTNVTVNAALNDRHAALSAALEYHRDHEGEHIPEIEDVVGTAMNFEYYFKHGEFPIG